MEKLEEVYTTANLDEDFTGAFFKGPLGRARQAAQVIMEESSFNVNHVVNQVKALQRRYRQFVLSLIEQHYDPKTAAVLMENEEIKKKINNLDNIAHDHVDSIAKKITTSIDERKFSLSMLRNSLRDRSKSPEDRYKEACLALPREMPDLVKTKLKSRKINKINQKKPSMS